jgi:hypothetical protein
MVILVALYIHPTVQTIPIRTDRTGFELIDLCQHRCSQMKVGRTVMDYNFVVLCKLHHLDYFLLRQQHRLPVVL